MRCWNPPSCLPMGCSIPPVRAKQISGHLAIGPGASSSMIFGLLGVLAVDRGATQDVSAGHESVSGSGEPTGLSLAPATARKTTRRAPTHVTRLVPITLKCPDTSIQTETLWDTRDVRGQGFGQRRHLPRTHHR